MFGDFTQKPHLKEAIDTFFFRLIVANLEEQKDRRRRTYCEWTMRICLGAK